MADTGNNRILKLLIPQDEPGCSPLHVAESFKAALKVEDIDRRITFFSEASAGKYAQILGALGTDAQDYGDGMGPMILKSALPDEVNYEMQYEDGQDTYLFPVTFRKDDKGNWKILNF